MSSLLEVLRDEMSSIFGFFSQNKDAFSSFGTIVALAIFAFAVFQYRRAEIWKKSEFIAKLYKDFVDDASCQRAMWMLDWDYRPINFGSEEKPDVQEYSWDLLVTALRKHDATEFTDTEMRIRDIFDRFFLYLEQFERAI